MKAGDKLIAKTNLPRNRIAGKPYRTPYLIRDEWSKDVLFKKGNFYEVDFYIDNKNKIYSKNVTEAEGVSLICEVYNYKGEKIKTVSYGFYFDNYKTKLARFSKYFMTNQELRKEKLKQIWKKVK